MNTAKISNLVPFTDSTESVPADEEENIQKVLHSLKVILEGRHDKNQKAFPDVHVKGHGCAQGEFEVLAGLPPELAQGLFQCPKKYDCFVRFSNGAGEIKDDSEGDARGMAVKLCGVEGEKLLKDEKEAMTQDFVMINHPVFVAATVEHYARLEQVVAEAGGSGQLQAIGIVFKGDWDLPRHIAEMKRALQIKAHPKVNLISNTYYSMVPIRFGEYVAKYRMAPLRDETHTLPSSLEKPSGEADGLRLLLEDTLRQQEVNFEFQVQLRSSEKTMPVEDATVQWPEEESPFRTVATLRLFRQDIAPLRVAGNRLSFTVWHTTAAHRPLGGLNRLRREAYQKSSVFRHNSAGAVRKEPDGIDHIP